MAFVIQLCVYLYIDNDMFTARCVFFVCIRDNIKSFHSSIIFTAPTVQSLVQPAANVESIYIKKTTTLCTFTPPMLYFKASGSLF